MKRILVFFIALILSNLLYGQNKSPILATRGVIKFMPFRLANPYHSLQIGLEHRLARKIYLNHEAGWVFGTYRFMDAIENTNDKARGLILKSEIRYYLKDFFLYDDQRCGGWLEPGLLGKIFTNDEGEAYNMYFGLQVENRSVNFEGSEYQGNPSSIKINSNRLSFNFVWGSQLYFEGEDGVIPITLDWGFVFGYSLQRFGAKNLNGINENDAIDYYIKKKFIDGRSFFNFSPILKIGYAF